MPASQLGAVPQNQLDALPLFSAQSAASGGALTNIFGRVVRFFGPTDLGISGINFAADANGFNVLVTNFINVMGCRSFTCIMTRTNAAAGGALAAIDLRVQYRLSASDVPGTSLGALQNGDFTGSSSVNTASYTFPGMQAANELQRRIISWDDAEIVGIAGTAATIGDNVRLFFNIGSGALPPAGNVFSVYLWGSG